ncbi:MAG TPA: M20/M25/M40 family metallo-hydrolase [Woeseiaceae bacterium]|nr:M20/M25/M40 family metallo-hydrolase [Woeseiaceae bacterium]
MAGTDGLINTQLHRLAALQIGIMSLSLSASAAGLDSNEQRLIDWIDAHPEPVIELIEKTVNINSGTLNVKGVRAVGQVYRDELEKLGLTTEWIEMPPDMKRAGHLFAWKKTGDAPRVLMIGHLDTVFEAEEGFQSFRRDGNIAYGPGVDDMKSGNAVIVYALKALSATGLLDDIPVVVVMTGDEEFAGSPLSLAKKDLIEAAKWADIALGFEDGTRFDDTDWATIARRSSSNWYLEVTGKQSHSSQIFTDDVGTGAIFEAARILNAFITEVRGEEYLTFNAGTIEGGTDVAYDRGTTRGTTFGKSNVVPRKAIVDGDLRAISSQQIDRAVAKMEKIVADGTPHTSASIEFEHRYPPMAPTDGNRRLQALLSDINEELGRGPMPALDPSRRGAADISFAAPHADSLAGLGALGKGGHTPEETLELDSLPVAIKRAALLLYRLSQNQAVELRE